MSSFRVAAIVNEPLAIIRRFISWYRLAGAERIALYFDNPLDPAIADLQGQQDLDLIACTPEFWLTVGTTQETRFTTRQNAALTHAYHASPADWMLAVDADELVYCPDQSIADLLAAQHETVRSLVVQPAEYVQAPEPGAHFRFPITVPQVQQVYGAASGVFRKRLGLIGHSFGKSFHRNDQHDIRLRQHWAVDTTTDQPVPHHAIGHAERAYLLHYVAPDYATWAAKLEFRVSASGYTVMVKSMLEEARNAPLGDNFAETEESYAELFRLTHCIDMDILEKLRQIDGILILPEAEFGPVVAARHVGIASSAISRQDLPKGGRSIDPKH